MKFCLLLIGIFIFQESFSQHSLAESKVEFTDLDWLEGTWNRVNVKPGIKAFESWKKISPTEWTGAGFQVKGTDTVFLEKLRILAKDGQVYYVADVAENKEPVYFMMRTMSASGFVCENPSHDFPKKIIYLRQGNKLNATVSGDGRSIEFLFEKE